MLYPMMEVTKLGVNVESTILEGVISFLDMESYFIAFVIFIASVVIPMIKLIGLLFIFISLLKASYSIISKSDCAIKKSNNSLVDKSENNNTISLIDKRLRKYV